MDHKPLFAALFAIGLAIAAFAYGFDHVLTAYANETGAKVVAATIALVGSLAGTLVTIVGLLLKWSIDERTLLLQATEQNRLSLEAERAAALQRDAEERLRLEAAVSAVGLLSTDSGAEAPDEQKAGALFILQRLGNLELALTLTRDLLSQKKIAPASAALVLQSGLESDSEEIVNSTALYVWSHAALLADPPNLIYWPAEKWNTALSAPAKQYLVKGLVRCLMAVDLESWHEGIIVSVICLLREAASDPHEPVAHAAWLYLSKLEPITSRQGDVLVRDERVPASKFIPAEDQPYDSTPKSDRDLADRLEKAVAKLEAAK